MSRSKGQRVPAAEVGLNLAASCLLTSPQPGGGALGLSPGESSLALSRKPSRTPAPSQTLGYPRGLQRIPAFRRDVSAPHRRWPADPGLVRPAAAASASSSEPLLL